MVIEFQIIQPILNSIAILQFLECFYRDMKFGVDPDFHRLFDITKLPPCRQLERLPDGLGVMADDWAAAAYAAAILAVVSPLLQ